METVRILEIRKDTHDVMHIITERPNFTFTPGQAVDVAVLKTKWEKEQRPFTFTSLPKDDHLEFLIKIYPDHDGVTNQIGKLERGDSLKLGEVFGEIEYQGEGMFIAGGAGVTPFISIFRDLESHKKIGTNKLIFANKKHEDIIQRTYFESLLGENFINVLSEEEKKGSEHGYITKEIIEAQIESEKQYFYVCGPPPMMKAVIKILKELGINKKRIIKEDF